MTMHPELQDDDDLYHDLGPDGYWANELCGDVAAILRSGGHLLGHTSRTALAQAVGESSGTDYTERALELVALLARAITSDGMCAARDAARRLVREIGEDASQTAAGRQWIVEQIERVDAAERAAYARYTAACRFTSDFRGRQVAPPEFGQRCLEAAAEFASAEARP
jgi:hypothetical protein